MSESAFVVIGLGGAGGKIANSVAEQNDGQIRVYAIDTDFSAISRLGRCQQKRIGATRFDGAGSGGDSHGAGMAADETPDLTSVFDDANVAVIVAGLGKGTGSGVLPKMLAMAAERNVATIVFMVTPFQFEGIELTRKAQEAESSVSKLGDIKITCKNDELCPTASALTLEEAFKNATNTLVEGITLLWKMTMMPGYINIDPATLVKIIRTGRGACNFGLGIASGPQRAKEAVDSLLGNYGIGLATKLKGAKAALVAIIGGTDLKLKEISDTMKSIASSLSIDAEIRMGTVLDKSLSDEIHVAVLLFREWNPPYPDLDSESNCGSEPDSTVQTIYTPRSSEQRSTKIQMPNKNAASRFQNAISTCVNGENLDRPTYLRRKLHIDL